jgi:hypothetical protein
VLGGYCYRVAKKRTKKNYKKYRLLFTESANEKLLVMLVRDITYELIKKKESVIYYALCIWSTGYEILLAATKRN